MRALIKRAESEKACPLSVALITSIPADDCRATLWKCCCVCRYYYEKQSSVQELNLSQHPPNKPHVIQISLGGRN